MYGYGILNNHVPTLKATAMRGGGINPLNTSLYSVYKAESNANDSLATYNGTAVGGLTYTAGKSGNAFTSNGTNSYVLLPTNMFSSFTGSWSTNYWMNLQYAGGDSQNPFSAFYYDGANFYGINHYIQNAIFNLQIYNGTPTFPAPNLITYGIGSLYYNWVMVTATRTPTSTKLYINGSLVASNTSTLNAVFHASTTPSLVARIFSGNVQYVMLNGGKIDEFNAWTKELTATEVTELYNAGTGKFYPY